MAYVSTETTRRVRGELKQRFPNLKFSVSKKDGTLRVRIMAGDLDFRDIWEAIPDNKQYWKRYGNPKPHFDGYVSINTYHPDDYNPKYTDLFKQIISIMKGTEWFDNSDPQIDYFSTAYYLKLSVGKWDKPYQYTGTPRMDDIFRRFRGEEDEHIHKYEPMRNEKDYMICRGCDGILHKELIEYLYQQCPRCDCAYCNPMGLSEGERAKERMKVIMSYYDAGLMPYINRANAEEFRGEESMHPNWCSNCGMKNDGCINLGYGGWYCMNFLNNRETYDGRYDRFIRDSNDSETGSCNKCGMKNNGCIDIGEGDWDCMSVSISTDFEGEEFEAPKPQLTKNQMELLNHIKVSAFHGGGRDAYVKTDRKGWDGFKPQLVQKLLDKGIITIPKHYGRIESLKAYTVMLNPIAWEYPFKYGWDKSLKQKGNKIVRNKRIHREETARKLEEQRRRDNMTFDEVYAELFGAEYVGYNLYDDSGYPHISKRTMKGWDITKYDLYGGGDWFIYDLRKGDNYIRVQKTPKRRNRTGIPYEGYNPTWARKEELKKLEQMKKEISMKQSLILYDLSPYVWNNPQFGQMTYFSSLDSVLDWFDDEISQGSTFDDTDNMNKPDPFNAEEFGAEGEDMNLLNTYHDSLRIFAHFEEEVYRLSPDIYAEVHDRMDYEKRYLWSSPSYQDRIDRMKQFQNRVKRMDENIYQRAMEKAQMMVAKNEEDFDAEGEGEEDAIGYCGVCNSPYDFNGVEETCGVMCRNCPKELTDGPNWKLSAIRNPLHANYHFDNMRGESSMCYYGTNCQKCDSEPVAIIAWEESWDEPDYFCSSCWNNMEDDETEFYERIAIQPSNINNIKNKNLIAKKLLNAEGEDMSLKDSAKLGFGLGAGLLGFRVALLGASALVGGLLLNRK